MDEALRNERRRNQRRVALIQAERNVIEAAKEWVSNPDVLGLLDREQALEDAVKDLEELEND